MPQQPLFKLVMLFGAISSQLINSDRLKFVARILQWQLWHMGTVTLSGCGNGGGSASSSAAAPIGNAALEVAEEVSQVCEESCRRSEQVVQ
jgi:hypothetical protein